MHTGRGSVLLSVRGLRKAFGGLVAVRDLSFDVPPGGITGLIGPNGSGKTTVLNLITARASARRGLDPVPGRGDHRPPLVPRSAAPRIARTFQLVRVLPHMTTRENVMLGRMFGSEPTDAGAAAHEADALLERVGLAGRGGLFGVAAHLHRPEARRARARAGDAAAAAPARRMARRPQSDRTADRHRADPPDPRRRHHHRHDRARDGGDPRALRPASSS